MRSPEGSETTMPGARNAGARRHAKISAKRGKEQRCGHRAYGRGRNEKKWTAAQLHDGA